MTKQDLKKYCMHPHVSAMDNMCDPLLKYMHNGCERLTACLQSTHRVHRHALQSKGKIILIYSYFVEFRVYFNPYCDMTLGFKSLGLVLVLSLYLPLFLRKFSFMCIYLALMVML